MSTQALELPVLPAPRIDEGTYRRLAKRVRLLSWLSLAWMTVEGTVAGDQLKVSSLKLD